MQTGEGKLYTGRFFDFQHEASLRSARRIVPIVMKLIAPKSVLDVGCGTGGWLHAFSEAGISDYLGIDGDYVDPSQLAIPQDRFQPRDLKDPFDLGRKFDLAISMEVAEHLPISSAGSFVASLTKHAKVVLFSAAIPQQGGTGHVNEQFQSYWIDQFSRLNYEAIDCVRTRVWHDPQVLPWYSQNSFLFVHRDAMTDALRDEQTNQMEPDVVHPGVLANCLAQQEYKLRIDLTNPPREHLLLSANVQRWLGSYAQNLNALREARGELALIFADAGDEKLQIIFNGPLRYAYRQLLDSPLRREAVGEAEGQFLGSRFPARPIDWKDADAAATFLTLSLYHLPRQIPLDAASELIPAWLREDVARFVTVPAAG